jgi:rhodanese-related sulfurtransferase
MKNIIDIRSKDKYNASHIPGAINIDSMELLNNPSRYLNMNDIYYLYCTSGYTSSMVSNKLNKLGYNTVNIDGGFNNYLLRK